MDATAARYADWKAPAQDGQVLIWPEPPDLLADAERNGRLLASADHARFQNVPLGEARRRLREWIGHKSDAPLIGTGHQAELHHPGVWVKNALIDAVAQKLGGAAYHFAVDTDEPKHLHLRWPGGGSERLTDDPNLSTANWSGLLDPPTPAHLRHLSDTFADAASQWGFRPLAPDFLQSLRRLSLESPKLPAALTNSLHELDWSLGLRHHALTMSPVFGSAPYLLFAHHVLAHTDRFAADYNAALDEYRRRRRNRIRTPGRPMPDLKVTPDWCEVPFWLDALSTGNRERATVIRTNGVWTLRAPGNHVDAFEFRPDADGWQAADRLAAWLRGHDLRLAPRALMLTTLLRLLVADQFVHGIGGGRYDQVTDRLIETHFGLEPPRFAVTTATLYFPGALGRQRTCVSCVVQEGHGLRHSVLGESKRQLVEAIAAAPRRSTERSLLFYEMHGRLEAAAENNPVLKNWERRLTDARRQDAEEQDLFDRELFYAIQPRERLETLIEQYRRAFT